MTTSLDFSPLTKALASLDKALARRAGTPADEELRDACIQRFEYSFELCWKMLKRQLEQEVPTPADVDTWSYRHLIREAAERGLLDTPEAWFDFREKRNITSHAYDQAKAEAVAAALPAFATHARRLLETLLSRS